MLSLVAVLLSCVALSHATCCSSGDAAIVASQWDGVLSAAQSGSARITIASGIFERLFAAQSGAAGMFPGGGDFSTAVMQAQMTRVVSGIDLCVHSVADSELNQSITAHLNAQHVARGGVTAAAMTSMQAAIEGTMEQLVSDYNNDAWHDCIGLIVGRLSVGL